MIEGSGSVTLTNGSPDPDPGGLKRYGSGSGSGSATLVLTVADDVRDESEPVGQLLPGERALPRRSAADSARRRSLGRFAGRNDAREYSTGRVCVAA